VHRTDLSGDSAIEISIFFMRSWLFLVNTRPSTRESEKQSQQEIQGNACRGRDPGQAECDSIQHRSEQVLIADGSDGMRIGIFAQESILVRRVAPECIETNCCDHKRSAVNSRGKVLVGARGILRKERRGKGNKDDQQHEQQIEYEQDIVCAPDMGEQAVMVDPHNPDSGKACYESEEGYSMLKQGMA
jgi:hypothetical protein